MRQSRHPFVISSSRPPRSVVLYHLAILSLLTPLSIIMATESSSPVTRIACFRFRPNVSAEEKGGRTSAFLDLYAQHPELLLVPPKGGRPLNTPLDLTNVKREKDWDTGFVVVFKVHRTKGKFGCSVSTADWRRMTMRGRSLMWT
jgi:hypothetical protein